MSETEGWEQVFKPWLEDKIKHSWLDPRKASDWEKFKYEYIVAWGFSQAASEILDFVKIQIETAKELEKKKRKAEDNFAIGGE